MSSRLVLCSAFSIPRQAPYGSGRAVAPLLCPAKHAAVCAQNGDAFIVPVGSPQLAHTACTALQWGCSAGKSCSHSADQYERSIPGCRFALCQPQLHVNASGRRCSALLNQGLPCARFPYANLVLIRCRLPVHCVRLSFRAGIIPLVLNRDIGGPIGKSVSDVAKVFTAINDFSMFPNGVDPRSVLHLLKCFSAGCLKQLYSWRPAGRGMWSLSSSLQLCCIWKTPPAACCCMLDDLHVEGVPLG